MNLLQEKILNVTYNESNLLRQFCEKGYIFDLTHH